MRVSITMLLLTLLAACTSTKIKQEGREITLEQKQRLEAPVDLGLEFLANSVELQVSRNYFKELLLPAAGGTYADVQRQPEKHRWLYRSRPSPTMQMLNFGLRKLKGHATKALTVECPPITDFRIRLRALGEVSLVVRSTGKTFKGRELLVDGGRVTIDGRRIDLAPATPPAGRGR